jgi:hypothetical protein
MKITDNLRKVNVAVVLDTFHGGNLGIRIGQLAIKALTRGINTTAWENYMRLFADNQEQLDRLTKESPDDTDWLIQSRAYIVSNAICDAQTKTDTLQNVRLEIDDNLAVAASPGFEKPIDIGEIP